MTAFLQKSKADSGLERPSDPRPVFAPRQVLIVIVANALLLAAVAIPVFSVRVPPLNDYIDHLARMHILAHISQDPLLQKHYSVHWLPAPYLAMDAVVPYLTHYFTIYAAGKLFIIGIFLLCAIGVLLLNFACFRELSLWPSAMYLFVYNHILAAGEVNYLFGVGVWLLAFAIWVLSEEWLLYIRLGAFMFLGLVVYFSHWFAFAGYALTIGSYEINQWWRTSPRSLPGLLSRTAIASTQFIVPCALFLTLPLGMTGGHTSYLPLAVQLTQTLRSPTWFPGTHFDVVILGFAFGIALIGFSTGFLRLCPAMRLSLAALCIAALVMPHDINGVTENELRLPVAVVYFAIAACRFNPEFRVTGTIVAAVIAALIIVNTVSIELWFLDLGKQYDEFLAALPVIKPGSRLLVFSAHKAIRADLKRGPTGAYQHMADVAVIEDDVFLPYLFKNPIMTVHATDLSRAIDSETGHPISVTQLWDGADAVKGPAMLGKPEGLGVRNFWGDWPHHFDYVVGLTFGADVHLPPYLTAVHAGSFFNIYKVTAPASK